ncbi:fatty acid amide hydrolase-like [Paramuricea clavata]|uniref:Fatty acid amide hydrolase-like n=1 Tax=Paramuricea clavata TaxID=317549 RepID=A0A6S7G719_PARCT|nr:fatty acid amide hydrolase-like [Paramuricea clavata]
MAQESTRRYAENKTLSLIDGIPVAIKEEIGVAGYHKRCGTVFMGQVVEEQDSNLVAKLRGLGAIIIGVTNMHELGLGTTGVNPNSCHGTSRNPYHLDCYAGGSSGGSGSAVAAGICPVAIGKDGGGSIRIPSTLCGVVGIKQLAKLPDKLCFIWMSTRDIFLRKSSYPCKHRYGLEFSIKHKSLHLVLCILLAGDIATNPGPTLPNAQFGNLSPSHLQVPVDERPNNEFGPAIALANMMSLAPKIDELRCFVENTKPDLISLTENWLNDSISEHHLNIPGYNLLLKNRTSGVHGGVGLYIKNSIKFNALTDIYHPQLETTSFLPLVKINYLFLLY